jgi:uncharacterized protein DUF488
LGCIGDQQTSSRATKIAVLQLDRFSGVTAIAPSPTQVAPSTELRKWYSHDPERFEEFGRRYREELKDAERAQACRDQRGRRACRPDQGLSRAVLATQ